MKTTTAENIRKELKALADPKYRKFHSYLLPGTDNILGVRIPQLRTMAKEIIKKDDWRPFVETANTNYYEETMLQGMIIGLAKMNLDEQINCLFLESTIGQYAIFLAVNLKQPYEKEKKPYGNLSSLI